MIKKTVCACLALVLLLQLGVCALGLELTASPKEHYDPDEAEWDINTEPGSSTPTPAPGSTAKPEDLIFTFDMTSAAMTASKTSGYGHVQVDPETKKCSEALFARVTWVYTLSDGQSLAYCAIKPVAESDRSFSMASPSAPFGATLDAVQLALVTDPNADQSGMYTPYAIAKMTL